jgi:hypothetical protein
MSDGFKDLNYLGSIEIIHKDSDGRIRLHFREGRGNVGVGLMKALSDLTQKAGMTPEDVKRELESYIAEQNAKAALLARRTGQRPGVDPRRSRTPNTGRFRR